MGQLALLMHTQRLSVPRMKPGGQHDAPTHTQADSPGSYSWFAGQHAVLVHTQSRLIGS
jgi:hypothetical protein